MLRSLVLTLPLLALGACASQPDQPEHVAQAKQDCERSYGTGSMLPKKDCVPAMSEEDRQRMNDELQRDFASRGSAPPSGSGK